MSTLAAMASLECNISYAKAVIQEKISFEKELANLSALTGKDVTKSLEIESFSTEMSELSKSKRVFISKSDVISNLCDYVAKGLSLEQAMYCTYYDLTGRRGLEKLINGNIARKESILNYFKRISFEIFMKEL